MGKYELQRARVVAVIRNPAGKLLVLKILPHDHPQVGHIPAVWEFPAGGIEFGEEPFDAVARETKEETGLECGRPLVLFSSSHVFETDKAKVHEIAITYLLETDEPEDAVDITQEEREHSEYIWLTLDEIERLPDLSFTLSGMLPQLRKILADKLEE
ncbi:MAG: NUDIX hydrolase [Candidatus Aenigmarchaeota archaeon]|nr:NUDIX hydrolase [Candidatus Aenigmarchaeota archaeon]